MRASSSANNSRLSSLCTRDDAKVSPASSAVRLGLPAGEGVHPEAVISMAAVALATPRPSLEATHACVHIWYARLHACMYAYINACLLSVRPAVFTWLLVHHGHLGG